MPEQEEDKIKDEEIDDEAYGVIVNKNISETLTPRQELFCKTFASDREFFGNGVQSYLIAYPKALYNTARTNASILLTNPNILRRINELLETDTLNDQNVDKQLAFVVQQNSDLGAKMRAINEYNKLKQRIIDKSESKVIVETPEPDPIYTELGKKVLEDFKSKISTKEE